MLCVVCDETFWGGDDGDEVRGSAVAAGWLSTRDTALPETGMAVADFLTSRDVLDADDDDGGGGRRTTTEAGPMLCAVCSALVVSCDAAFGRYTADVAALRERRRVAAARATASAPSGLCTAAGREDSPTTDGVFVPITVS
jgi:hypothetical protein